MYLSYIFYVAIVVPTFCWFLWFRRQICIVVCLKVCNTVWWQIIFINKLHEHNMVIITCIHIFAIYIHSFIVTLHCVRLRIIWLEYEESWTIRQSHFWLCTYPILSKFVCPVLVSIELYGLQDKLTSKLSIKRNLSLLQSDSHWNPLHQTDSYLETD